MPTILMSVFDKKGLEHVAGKFKKWGWDILASGGTAKYLEEHSIAAQDVASLVGDPLGDDHLVVTLSREVHAGLLFPDTPESRAKLAERGIPFIDAVYVNLYPLAEELANPEATLESLRVKTDSGGPAMLRSAAKGRRLVAVDMKRMDFILDQLARTGGDPARIGPKNRRELAHVAERAVTAYGLASCAALAESGDLRSWYAHAYEVLTNSPLDIQCNV